MKKNLRVLFFIRDMVAFVARKDINDRHKLINRYIIFSNFYKLGWKFEETINVSIGGIILIAKKNNYYTSRKILGTYFLLLVLVPYIVLSTVQIVLYVSSINRETVKAGKEVVEQMNLVIEKQVSRVKNFVTMLTLSKEYQNAQEKRYFEEYGYKLYECYDDLKKLIQNNTREDFNIKSLVIVNKHRQAYIYGESGYIDFEDAERTSWYQDAVEENGKFCWFSKSESEESGFPGVLIAARKVYNLETFEENGIIYLEVWNDFFDLNLTNEDDDSVLYLIDEKDEPLFALNKKAESHGSAFLTDLTVKIMESDYQENELCKLDGESYIPVVSARSQDGWAVVKAIPISQLTGTVIGGCLIIGGIVACCFAMFFAMFLIVYKRIAYPMQYLIGLINEIKSDPEIHVDLGKYPCYEAIQLSSEIVSLSRENEDAQGELLEIAVAKNREELEKLQAQINPHYIYNTLTAIKYKALQNQQREISDMITALVKILRSTVNRDGSYIMVSQEVDNLNQYIYIQRILSKNRINFTVNVNPETEKYYMPNFLLQPLVENAIIHGLNPKGCEGDIEISIEQIGNNVKIEVTDNGVGVDLNKISEMNPTHTNGAGVSNIALPGIMRKIELLYGGRGSFKIEPVMAGGTKVTVIFPVRFEHRGE